MRASSRKSIKKLSATSRTRGASVEDAIRSKDQASRPSPAAGSVRVETFRVSAVIRGVRVALCGLVVVVLAACAGGGPAGGHDPLPAALQAWVAFPVDASPRPIVLVDAPVNGPRGFYGSEKAKIAFASGAFDRPTRLPTGPDTAGGYPIISADKAFDLLKSQAKDPPAGGLRLTTSDVRLGTSTFLTDRGEKSMPAWLFSMAEVDGPVAVLAIAPEAQWFPSELVSGQSHDIGASVGSDHRTLTVNFVGAESENGPCGVRYSISLTESHTAVIVTVVSNPNETTAACTLAGYQRRASAVLNAPLGPLELVDEQGYPFSAMGSP